MWWVLYDLVVCLGNAALACERSFPGWMRVVSAILAARCLVCALDEAWRVP